MVMGTGSGSAIYVATGQAAVYGAVKTEKKWFLCGFFLKGSALNSAEHGNVTGVARPIFRHPIWNLAACPPLKSPIFALSHDPRMTGVVGLRRFAPNASWTPSMAMRRVQGQEAAMHSCRVHHHQPSPS